MTGGADGRLACWAVLCLTIALVFMFGAVIAQQIAIDRLRQSVTVLSSRPTSCRDAELRPGQGCILLFTLRRPPGGGI